MTFFSSISRLIYVLVSRLGSEVDDRLFVLFFSLHYIFLVTLLRCAVLPAVDCTSTFLQVPLGERKSFDIS